MQNTWNGVRLALTAILFALVGSTPVEATLTRRLGIEELVIYSDSIVYAECERIRTEWIDKKIYTIATMKVGLAAKGKYKKDQEIEVYMLGGRVTEPLPVKMHVPDGVTMHAGEEAVLFLETSSKNPKVHRIVGMRQGKLPVGTDEKSNRKTVRYWLPLKGAPFIDPDDPNKSNGPPPEGDEVYEPGSLKGFLGRLQSIEEEREEQSAETKGPTNKRRGKE